MSATKERLTLDRTAVLAVLLTLPGKAVTGVMILLCPACAAWLGLRGLRTPTKFWRALSLIAMVAGISLLAIFVSHMMLDR